MTKRDGPFAGRAAPRRLARAERRRSPLRRRPGSTRLRSPRHPRPHRRDHHRRRNAPLLRPAPRLGLRRERPDDLLARRGRRLRLRRRRPLRTRPCLTIWSGGVPESHVIQQRPVGPVSCWRSRRRPVRPSQTEFGPEVIFLSSQPIEIERLRKKVQFSSQRNRPVAENVHVGLVWVFPTRRPKGWSDSSRPGPAGGNSIDLASPLRRSSYPRPLVAMDGSGQGPQVHPRRSVAGSFVRGGARWR